VKSRRQAILDVRFNRLIDSVQLSELSEMKTGRGRLNPFVSGLLLSSAILEEIQQEAPYNVHVSWGQILDENDTLSGEIDIMAYLGKPLHEWKSIGYAIIPKRQVGKIFEVKGHFQSYKSHEEDYQRLSNFAPKIFLIIYQSHNTINGIKKREEKLKSLGYHDAFHLVRITKSKKKRDGTIIGLYENWYSLMDTVSGRLEEVLGDY
jgi:hypothetical protein